MRVAQAPTANSILFTTTPIHLTITPLIPCARAELSSLSSQPRRAGSWSRRRLLVSPGARSSPPRTRSWGAKLGSWCAPRAQRCWAARPLSCSSSPCPPGLGRTAPAQRSCRSPLLPVRAVSAPPRRASARVHRKLAARLGRVGRGLGGCEGGRARGCLPASMLPASEQTCAGWSPIAPPWLAAAWFMMCMAWKNIVRRGRAAQFSRPASRFPKKVPAVNWQL